MGRNENLFRCEPHTPHSLLLERARLRTPVTPRMRIDVVSRVEKLELKSKLKSESKSEFSRATPAAALA